MQGLQGNSSFLSTDESLNAKSMDLEGKEACPFAGSGMPMPQGHEKYSEADKEKCPVMSGKIKAPIPGSQEIEVKSAAKDGTKKKEKKPKGGCPFMPSDNKKPPALELYTAAFEEPYISPLRYLINFRGFLSSNESNSVGREKWESLPIFFKHTLFHNEEKMGKIRKLEVAHRFFIYDKFREQAHKRLNKGRPEEALGLFEHALSCFKWVKYKEKKKEKKPKKEKTEEKTEDEGPEIEIAAEKSAEEPNEEVKENEENTEDIDDAETEISKNMKPFNKAMMSIITDEDFEICDGEELADDSERDMRNSMLLNVYQGLAVCYLRLSHYSEAMAAVEEAMKMNNTSSQLFFRRAQVRAFNKGSTLEDLTKAKQDIERALEMKHYEKLFKSEPGVLKILNIHNADEVYLEQARYIEAAIKEKRQNDFESTKALLARVKEIEHTEEALRKEGKIPAEEPESAHTVDINAYDEEQMEWEIINEMVGKYIKIIEFYQETDKKDQVVLAKKEIQVVLELREKMRFYHELDFTKWEENAIVKEILKDINIDMSSKKVQDRLRRLKNSKAKELFENGKFNFEVFQYALKDYFKKKEEKEEKLKKEKESQEDAEPKKNRLFSLFGVEVGLQMVAIGLMFLAFWYLSKNNMLLTGLFWSDNKK